MTAEPIARVVADLRAGRLRYGESAPSGLPPEVGRRLEKAIIARQDRDQPSMFELASSWAATPGKVIDATAIYRRLVEQSRPVWLYEDHPCIAPPFPRFDVCYRNEHGNVIVMCAMVVDVRDGADNVDSFDTMDATREFTQPEPWQPAEPVDWDRVRWTIDTFLFVGGRGANGPAPTTGPLHLWRFAVYDDGAPADLHWVRIRPPDTNRWDMAHLVLLGALSFLSCRNVELVEPRRDRAERRRLARTGVTVHELAVFPIGRSTRRRVGEAEPVGVPLTSVRGHFASYGPKFGRGLLFGKYEGRYWIGPHARGEREHGEHDTSYVLADDGPGGGG